MPSKMRKPSFVFVLSRALFLGLLVVFSIMAAFLHFYGSKMLKSSMDDQLDYIITTQSNSIAQLLWDFEVEKIDVSLKNITDDERIKSAQIIEYSDYGESVFAEKNWDEKESKASEIRSHDIVYINDLGEKRALGALRIILDYTSVEASIRNAFITGALFFLVSFFALVVMFLILIKRATNPIVSLSKSLVGADYFTHKIEKPQSSTREIDDLFETLIDMQLIMQSQTQEIQSQKALLDTIIDNLPLGMTVEHANESKEIVIINNMYKKFFGLTSDVVKADNHLLITDIHEKQDAEFLENLNERVVREAFVKEVHDYSANTSKNPFIAKVIKAPIVDENGDVTFLITMVSDETKRYKAHKETLKAKEDAERANKVKSEFWTQSKRHLTFCSIL